MRNARFLEDLAQRQKTVLAIEAFGVDLRMQEGLAEAALAAGPGAFAPPDALDRWRQTQTDAVPEKPT